MNYKEDKLGWFWNILSESDFDLKKLESQLKALDKSDLEYYYGIYQFLADEIVFCVETENLDLSEDGLEILNDWIVSQGYSYWLEIIKGDRKMASAIEKHEKEETDDIPSWDLADSDPDFENGYDPRYMADEIYELKYEISMAEISEEIMEKIEDLIFDKLPLGHRRRDDSAFPG